MIESIGPYQVDSELGRGGMGVVYRARDTRLDRDVAIKALPTEFAADPARLERFRREAKVLAQLDHPNVAHIYGVEEIDDQVFLVLEFVDGITLAERLDRGPLPADDAIEIENFRPYREFDVNSDGSELMLIKSIEQREGNSIHLIEADPPQSSVAQNRPAL